MFTDWSSHTRVFGTVRYYSAEGAEEEGATMGKMERSNSFVNTSLHGIFSHDRLTEKLGTNEL